MSYSPSSFLELSFLVLGLWLLSVVSWKRTEWALFVILFSLPTYLVRLGFWFPPLGPKGIPTTLLEVMILIFFLCWLKEKPAILFLKTFFRRTPLGFWLPILLIFYGAFVSAVVAPDKLKSLGILKGFFVDPVLFLLVFSAIMRDAGRTKKKRALLEKCFLSLVFSGLSVALIALVYFREGNLTYDGRLRAFYESPNHLAMYLAPLFLLSSYFVLSSWGILRLVWLFVAGILGAVLYFTFSFGAWVGVLGGLAFLAFWLFAYEKKPVSRIASWRPWYMRVRGVFVSILILLLLTDLFWFAVDSSGKLQGLAMQGERNSLESRLMIWRAAWEIGKDHPLFGIGLGTFQEYYLAYQERFDTPYLEWAVPHPHNLFFAFWLYTGLAGFIGFLWLLSSFFKNAIGKIKTGFSEENLFFVVLGSIFVYFVLHGLIDTPFWKNDLALLTMFLLVGVPPFTILGNKNDNS